MNRRSFLGFIATAVTGTIAATQVAKVTHGKPLTDLYPHGMTVYGDGTGGQWIVDGPVDIAKLPGMEPYLRAYDECLREMGDSEMYYGLARFEFSKAQPRQSRVIGLGKELDDAV